jgi:hypothetical protein
MTKREGRWCQECEDYTRTGYDDQCLVCETIKEEDQLCGNCNGSGEGYTDGSKCSACKGSGVENG